VPRPLFTPGKDPVPIVQEAGLAPEPVWRGVENLAPLGFDPRTVQPVASRYTYCTTRSTRDGARSRNTRVKMAPVPIEIQTAHSL
jgi:hypothetical protein